MQSGLMKNIVFRLLLLSLITQPIHCTVAVDEASDSTVHTPRTAVSSDFDLLACGLHAQCTLSTSAPSNTPFQMDVEIHNHGSITVPSLPNPEDVTISCIVDGAPITIACKHQVFLSYHLFNKTTGVIRWDCARTPLTQDFLAGATSHMTLNIDAIADPANYVLHVDMINSPHGWATNTTTTPFLGKIDLADEKQQQFIQYATNLATLVDQAETQAKRNDAQVEIWNLSPPTLHIPYGCIGHHSLFTLLSADGSTANPADRQMPYGESIAGICSFSRSVVLSDFTAQFPLLKALNQTGIKKTIFGATYSRSDSEDSNIKFLGRPLQVQPHMVAWWNKNSSPKAHTSAIDIRFFSLSRPYDMQIGIRDVMTVHDNTYSGQSRFVKGLSIDQATGRLLFSVVDIIQITNSSTCQSLPVGTRVITAHFIDSDKDVTNATERAQFAQLIRGFSHPNPGHYLDLYTS